MINELNQRSQEIFRQIVNLYLETGEPVGSRTLSRLSGLSLSPATIRNVMADLEDMGVLHAPHTSAGRLPTQAGLRLFIDGMMEINQLSRKDMDTIRRQFTNGDDGHDPDTLYERATQMLSGLSTGAGLVIAPKADKILRQIQFTSLSPGRILVIIISEDGLIENRLVELPDGQDIPASILTRTANYLNERLAGRTLGEGRQLILDDIAAQRTALDTLSEDLIRRGLAETAGPKGQKDGIFLVRGQSNLLNDIRALEDLERLRQLFDALERKETMLSLLTATQDADGVQIFIGSENPMFTHSGLSLVLSPTRNLDNDIIGAIGVIGPTRLNYGRIVPVMDYTSQLLGSLIHGR